MPQLDISNYISQLFWLIILFGFLLIMLTYVTVPNIRKILTERKKNIKKSMFTADELTIEANAHKESYEQKISAIYATAALRIVETNQLIKKDIELHVLNLNKDAEAKLRIEDEKLKQFKSDQFSETLENSTEIAKLILDKFKQGSLNLAHLPNPGRIQ